MKFNILVLSILFSLKAFSQSSKHHNKLNKVDRFIPVNGIIMHCEIYGKGHPLLVLHGNGGSTKSASSFYDKLKDNYKIIAIDSRAQGKSTDNENELSYELMANDINAVLDTLKIDSLYIWGHSDGGIIGLLLAIHHPDKVSKLVTSGANVTHDSTATISWQQDINEDLNKLDKKTRKLHKLMLDHPNIGFDALTKIKAPVLVISGDRDIIKLEHTIEIFRHIPNSQLCIIPGATHSAAWEKSDYFLLLLTNFFDKPFRMPDSMH